MRGPKLEPQRTEEHRPSSSEQRLTGVPDPSLGPGAHSDALQMGCGGSKEEDVKSMPAGQVVGKSQGAQITREEARERAAAAAEARAKASGRNGGGTSSDGAAFEMLTAEICAYQWRL